MAGRRAAGAIELALFGGILARVAGAIALDTLAFVVWNVGTRPPLAVVRDIRRGLGSPRVFARGTVVALAGAILVVAASILVAPAVDFDPALATGIHLFTVLVALALEALVGEELRSLLRLRAGSRTADVVD